MAKPTFIAELESTLGFSLNDLTQQAPLWKVIEHLAFLDACMDNRESATAADLERAAFERLNMSVCRNCYLCDADGQVIGLNLFGNGLTQLPAPEHPGWRRLRVLNLAENKLTELALSAGWQALQSLDLGDNQTLRALRFDGPLPALERLDASDSGLEHLVVPAGMAALKHLDVSRNKLRSVVFEGDCVALEWLDFSGNGLEGFRLSKGFDALQYLYLNNNALKSLVFDAPLVNLNTLHLSKNQLDELPGNLFLFDKLESLYLHNNPLPAVPKGASGVPEGENDNAAVAIRNYLRSIIEDAPMPIDEVKLVLIGNSTAGKSSLIRYLIDGIYDETIPSTHGISNIIWDSKELGFKVNIWDFGGQEFYHATHRLFLTENALSLVVFESGTNQAGEQELALKVYENGQLSTQTLAIETFPYTYWLDSLRYFCAGKQTACLVQTKMDIGESIPVDSKVKADFRIPADTPRVSAKSAFEKIKPFDRKFDDFKDALFSALKAAKGKYPFSDKWLLIKNELRKLAKTKPVLTLDAYVAFCEKLRPNINYKKKDQPYSMLDTLTDYLHETGVILYFRNIAELRDKVFIRPDWVTDAIYQVLDYAVMRNNGLFDLEHVARVFPDLDAHDLIRIMEKFEIIFPVNNKEGYYLAPQYFSDKNPRENPDGNYYKLLAQSCTHLQFVLRFPQFLPRSVITRFMCKYGPLARETYWKNGIQFLVHDGLWVWVERENATDVVIRTNQPAPEQARIFFSDFCRILTGKPEAESAGQLVEVAQMDATIQVSTDGKDFVTVQKLLRHPGVEQSPTIETVDGDYIAVEDLSRLVHLKAELSQETNRLKCFVSYAHADDSRYMRCFIEGIKAHSNWEIFDDRGIGLGAKWDETLQEEVEKCDFGIYLLSQRFIKSEYIREKEFGAFVERQNKSGFPFFGILLSACNFRPFKDIADRQFFIAYGQDYGLADTHRDKQITFDRLARINDRGEILPNPDLEEYFMNFVAAANAVLKEKYP